jgi:RNA polymerase sigma factor (sigma-70 family)
MARRDQGITSRHLNTLFGMGATGGLSDAQLLELFSARRDEAADSAFGALLERHGPMVLRVCRAVLRDPHEAQDAFQATFLVLVRRADSLWVRDSLGPWLHQVAYRTASCACSAAARRRRHEGRAAELAPRSSHDGHADDLGLVVHEEVDRLPERYRAAVILCLLEGLTPEQAARQLGWPDGTVHSRLARGRAQLRDRLTRRGLAPSGSLANRESSPDAVVGSVPATLAASTIRAATRFAAGRMAAGTVSESVNGLIQGVLRAMFLNRLRMTLVTLVAGLALVSVAGILVRRAVASPQQSSPGGVRPGRGAGVADGPGETSRPEGAAREALGRAREDPDDHTGTRQLALAVHAKAASFDKLTRFSYQVRYRHGIVDSMRAVDVSIDRLKQALASPVAEKDWIGWYESHFSWDEQRFIWEMRPGNTQLNYDARFWTRADAWERHEANDKSSVNFVRSAEPAKSWKGLDFFDYGYLRLTPHHYWWGRTAGYNGQTMSLVPPDKASWRPLGVERFGGELCDLIDSPQRTERLWIGRDSGRVRGALSYSVANEIELSRDLYKSEPIRRIAGRAFDSQRDYSHWRREEASENQLIEVAVVYSERRSGADPSRIRPNELILFDDYREVAAGVWLPFREVRAFPHASETVPGKKMLIRSELRVESVRTDQELADRLAQMMPKDGDPVQDQRYVAPVDYEYRADRTDGEVRKLAEAAYSRRLEGTAIVKRLVEPIGVMVGKAAPGLPETGWVGNRPKGLAGRPYLLHFWATWCGPCKGDMPRLKSLAERGVIVLGMHPPGTPLEEVERVIRDQQLGYPTFLAEANNNDDAVIKDIGGYPVGVFPYCILVDAQGRVAGHGSLSEVLERFGIDALRGLPKGAVPGEK